MEQNTEVKDIIPQLLRASEALVKCGRGVCSQKTYDQICAILILQQRITDEPFDSRKIRDLCFARIKLSVSPYVPDGHIVPDPDWSYRDRQTD